MYGQLTVYPRLCTIGWSATSQMLLLASFPASGVLRVKKCDLPAKIFHPSFRSDKHIPYLQISPHKRRSKAYRLPILIWAILRDNDAAGQIYYSCHHTSPYLSRQPPTYRCQSLAAKWRTNNHEQRMPAINYVDFMSTYSNKTLSTRVNAVDKK